jgi:hypothetical protein
MIDFIIPTMWKFDLFPKFLKKYIHYDKVNKIIIIDNCHKNKPNNLIESDKILYYNPHNNIFVGPSWNIGVGLASSEFICILNDDINLEEKTLDFVLSQDFSKIDIIGSKVVNNNSDLSLEKIHIDKRVPLGTQSYNFGTCMFMKRERYPKIPSLYKCWFTDDYLVHQFENVYRLSLSCKENNKYGSSNTIKTIKNINERIDLDCKNAKKYLLHK